MQEMYTSVCEVIEEKIARSIYLGNPYTVEGLQVMVIRVMLHVFPGMCEFYTDYHAQEATNVTWLAPVEMSTTASGRIILRVASAITMDFGVLEISMCDNGYTPGVHIIL